MDQTERPLRAISKEQEPKFSSSKDVTTKNALEIKKDYTTGMIDIWWAQLMLSRY